MYMYMFPYMYMFICTRSFIRTCTCTCSFICTCTCTCSLICTCLYVHVPLYVHVHVQVLLYVHVYMFTCICILHTHYLAETIPVRLVNGKRASEGRIELLHNGEWGTICNYYTDINVGHVVCRELGYPGADKITTYAAFGEGKGHVLLAPKCIGNETTLLHCEHTGWGRYEKHCDHSHDSGVICIDGKYY